MKTFNPENLFFFKNFGTVFLKFASTEIKKISTFRLDAKGGSGVVRELIEKVLKMNILNFL